MVWLRSTAALNHPLLTTERTQNLTLAMERKNAILSDHPNGDLTPEEKTAVAEGEDAQKQFIASNLRLLPDSVRTLPVGGIVDRSDLISEGYFGLKRSVEKFDWRKGFEFSTYGVPWIRQLAKRGRNRQRLGFRVKDDRIGELQRNLSAVAGDEEGLSDSDRQLYQFTTPLYGDAPENTDSERTLFDTLSDGGSTEDTALQNVEYATAQQHMQNLDPRQRQALELYFGLDDGQDCTQREIGQLLGVSESLALQRIQTGLDSLRRMMGVADPKAHEPLTSDEEKLLELAGQGQTQAAIGEVFGISARSISNRLKKGQDQAGIPTRPRLRRRNLA